MIRPSDPAASGNTRSLPPGPRRPAFWQILRHCHSPLRFLDECRARYGDVFTLRLAGYGTLVMVASPEAINEIFRAEPAMLHSGESNEVLRALLGPNSVFVLDGTAHARQRRILAPPLRPEYTGLFMATARAATIAALRELPQGQPVALLPVMRRISLRVILQLALGLGPGSELEDWERRIHRMLGLARNRYSLILGKLAPHRVLRHARWLPFYKQAHDLDAGVRELICRSRQQPRARSPAHMLAGLLSARDDQGLPLTDDEIRDAVVTLIFAGHDTISVALGWALDQIAPRADVVGRIRDELQSIAGGEPLHADHLGQLAYLDAVVRETLRIRTVLPFVLRLTKAPFLAGGRTYPAGVFLCPCNHLVHQRPDLYPEPERFRPERFLERKYSNHEWFPFGGGNRACLGTAFAMQELKVVLGTIFANVDLARLPGMHSTAIRRGISLTPHDGVSMVVTRRHSRPNGWS